MGAVCGKQSSRNGSKGEREYNHANGNSNGVNILSTNLVIDNPNKLSDFYKVDSKVIGEGSYGSVSVATEIKTGNLRAVKVVSKADMKNNAKLFQEINLMKCLDHPNIIKLHETFSTDSQLFLVMEYCTGGELFDQICEQGIFTERHAARFMRQMCSPVYYLHRNHIVHRDLKPENFLLAEKPKKLEDATLKIIDFGLSCRLPTPVTVTKEDMQKSGVSFGIQELPSGSRRVQFRAKDGKMFQYNGWHVLEVDKTPIKTFLGHQSADNVGQLIQKRVDGHSKIVLTLKHPVGTLTTKAGTPYYVAPEVLGGSHGAQSDIWSLGVIAYILLCGYPPFGGNEDQHILIKVMRGKYSMPEEDFGHISKDGKQFIQRCLTFDHRKRITSEEAMNHPWIKQSAPNMSMSDVNLQKNFVGRLKGFKQQNALKKVAMFAIASSASDPILTQMKKAFESLDKNGDGILSQEEIVKGIETVTQMTPELHQAIKEMDTNGDGVSVTEFLAVVTGGMALKDNHHAMAFQIFDTDQSGTISRAELKNALLQRFGEIPEREIDQIMRDVDKNSDGQIDFMEFKNMMQLADQKYDN